MILEASPSIYDTDKSDTYGRALFGSLLILVACLTRRTYRGHEIEIFHQRV